MAKKDATTKFDKDGRVYVPSAIRSSIDATQFTISVEGDSIILDPQRSKDEALASLQESFADMGLNETEQETIEKSQRHTLEGLERGGHR